MFRALSLAATFAILIAGTFWLWSLRFEHTPGPSFPSLASFTGEPPTAVFTLEAGSAADQRKVFAIPDGLSHLHVSERSMASGLQVGRNRWDSGRIVIVWLSASGARLEHIPVASAKGDESSHHSGLVLPVPAGAVAAELVIQNLGFSGSYRVDQLNLSGVRETLWWRFGKWLLAVAWSGWMMACIHGLAPDAPRWRKGIAAIAWVAVAASIALPGPWHPIRALPGGFDLGHPQLTGTASDLAAEPTFRDLPPLAKVERKDSPLLVIREKLRWLRPALHVGFFCVAAFGFAALISPGTSAAIASMLSFAEEGAQWAFGYPPDFWDLVDLLTNAVGIVLGLGLWHLTSTGIRRWHDRRNAGQQAPR